MIPQWQKGIVKFIAQETPNTRRFWIELPETKDFQFIPGQYVTLDLPIHERRNLRWRSYSIATAPQGDNIIELIIVHANGLGTNYLFNEVKVGHELTLRGPSGTFILPQNIADKELFLICTGTGIAPFRSMVHHLLYHEIPTGYIHLVFGCRTKADLLYYDEMIALSMQKYRLHYHPTLSRETWHRDTGYVHAIYEGLCKEKQPAVFMLCGWHNMVDEAMQRIVQLGYDKKDILHELYG